jgi:hypothetical protein
VCRPGQRQSHALPPSPRLSQPNLDGESKRGRSGRRIRIEGDHGRALSRLPGFPLFQGCLVGPLRRGIGRNRADVLVEDAGELFSCFLDARERRRIGRLAFAAAPLCRLVRSLQPHDGHDQGIKVANSGFDILVRVLRRVARCLPNGAFEVGAKPSRIGRGTLLRDP